MANVNIPTKSTGDSFTAAELNSIVSYLNRLTVFRATVSQSGTDSPTLNVIENTTGLTFTPSRVSNGTYRLTFSSTINQNKAFPYVGSSYFAGNKIISFALIGGGASLDILIVNQAGSADGDGILLNTPVEILIYS